MRNRANESSNSKFCLLQLSTSLKMLIKSQQRSQRIRKNRQCHHHHPSFASRYCSSLQALDCLAALKIAIPMQSKVHSLSNSTRQTLQISHHLFSQLLLCVMCVILLRLESSRENMELFAVNCVRSLCRE
jgi:hypothetical protein